MPYNQKLADRIIAAVLGEPGISTKKMFGGFCFLLDGNMLCGVIDDKFVARVGKDNYEKSLEKKHTAPMDFTGRPLKGFIYVEAAGIKTEKSLDKWLDACFKFVKTLPPK